ncbi:hypothetical protein EI42_03478 [Thermosporothrix hazakensis]|uniref:Uncharacterized protein n=1 Tax=Thermosporothrix hazakensis TaxID=644383 RepID=A0A326U5T6_THEHA|nr:hypothetical protein EI42_03478 [Thermosporothrix hazakensis]
MAKSHIQPKKLACQHKRRGSTCRTPSKLLLELLNRNDLPCINIKQAQISDFQLRHHAQGQE